MDQTGNALSALRRRTLTDEALQAELTEAGSAESIAVRLAAVLPEFGNETWHAVLAEAEAQTLAPPQWNLREAPPRQWLPVQIFADGEGIKVEWLHFGFADLTEPFFEQSVGRALALQANRLLRCATPIDALLEFASAPMPDGLVFHMSRCGSTLVGQMCGALEGSAVVAEAPALDQAIQLHLAGQLPAVLVRGMVGALARDRTGATRRRFVKLDAWHTLTLPRIAGLFPEARWVFLFRDPLEVLVSQARAPGMHVTPGAIPFELFGLQGGETVPPDDYPAWVIAAIARAGLGAAGLSGGRLVDYTDLPGAVENAILPHFGIEPSADDLERLAATSGKYSKCPHRAFADDSAAKQEEASADMRERAETLGLIATYEALRHAGTQMRAAKPEDFRHARTSPATRQIAVNFAWSNPG